MQSYFGENKGYLHICNKWWCGGGIEKKLPWLNTLCPEWFRITFLLISLINIFSMLFVKRNLLEKLVAFSYCKLFVAWNFGIKMLHCSKLPKIVVCGISFKTIVKNLFMVENWYLHIKFVQWLLHGLCILYNRTNLRSTGVDCIFVYGNMVCSI